ncbi:MAG TPA: cytochrome c1 [Caulobacteraceae bacterium]|jgi:ubiquinol-cytochrome c reductase cytochrome c1 subunit
MKHSTFKGITRLATVFAAGVLIAGLAAPVFAGQTAKEPRQPSQGFTFEGPFGRHNQEQLQRGFKVWREVCSSCHSMNLVHFRDLGTDGGPFWDPKYPNPNDNPRVKALAAMYQVSDIDTTTGDAIKRPGIPADAFPAPYANDLVAAGANGGAAPPDHSTIAKAREGGARYIYSLIAFGYEPAPAGLKKTAAQNYNSYMPGDLSGFWSGKGPVPPGSFIAMPPPLKAGQVTFDDGTKSTLPQEAADVAAFLDWASDPHSEDRKEVGLGALAFLIILSGLTFFSYKRIWRNVSH